MKTTAENSRVKRRNYILIFTVLALVCFLPASNASDKWTGVDESVVEKYAKEKGREASESFINTDHGDLLLFVFLLAGAAGGFAAGYFWHALVACKKERKSPGQAG